MIGLLAVVIVCGSALFGGRYVLHALSHRWETERLSWERIRFAERGQANALSIAERDQREADRALEARRVAVAERAIALEESKHAKLTESKAQKPMPAALVARITAYDEPWAQDEERSRIMGLYAELQDWEQVASALPPLNPFIDQDIAAPRDGVLS